ncbi:HlyD family secretion protein [Bradyrhizobium diazoefficiens]|uniref:HlyD family secretion protein n=1 Tax=Bradyrhizobium diazoefficiens TaxID=1355477 RepID=UPI001909D046|nr:HlyD family secretion protein [Bradyrhizobium diazoefficiens]QQO37361.1 HlyD family secretion protein [Bradyrhizobium diazoefficiens]
MLELLLCSILTILPDYLFRRYVQGKHLGKEITFYSVWFELRWGIVSCLMLTIGLITLIFYFHPSSTTATLFFRTVPILPETVGRVAEVDLGVSEAVDKGAVLFKLDSSKQEAALETARRQIAEVDAAMVSAQTDVTRAEAQIQEAKSAHKQAVDELQVKSELQRRNPGIVPQRDIEKLQVAVDGRQATIDAAVAAKQSTEARVSTLLPAQKASAEAALAQAQVEYDKTIVRAGFAGRVEQFSLRVGDIVNPLMRPAGILIPEGAGRRGLQAGFPQIEAQVLKPGMVGEAVCISKPWTVIPLVVTAVQDYIATGQFRGGEQLLDAQSAARPGTILVSLEPIYEGGLEGVTAGSTCVVNAYTSNHDIISSGQVGWFKSFALHAIDAVGVVHAMLLRIQALLLPIQTLVLTGH